MPTANSPAPHRKRCLNDNKLFIPARNVPDQKFCCDRCRKEFHHHGSAFGPMKLGLHNAIDKKYAVLLKEVRKEMKEFRALCVNSMQEDMREYVKKAAVEVSELRAQIEALRGQYERHDHEFWTDGSAGDMSTYAPTEVRERQHEESKARILSGAKSRG